MGAGRVRGGSSVGVGVDLMRLGLNIIGLGDAPSYHIYSKGISVSSVGLRDLPLAWGSLNNCGFC